MRLIDADELKIKLADELSDALGETDFTDGLHHGLHLAISLAEETPLADAKPIRHGYWNILTPQDDDGGWVAIRCSNCNFTTPYASSRKEIEENGFVYHYCMYCGAKMDEKETDQ